MKAPRFLAGTGPIWFLLLFAPVSAEYLIGYDDTIGSPAALIFGLFVFAPLYGAPALLIREAARRTGRGWPTIILLSIAFGLVQAGLIDQSLFNPDYRTIPYWDNLRQPTLIPGVGASAASILGFVGGHMVGSICAPIALAESLTPRRATRVWQGTIGHAVMVALWVLGAGFVLADTLSEETFRPSTGQVAGTLAVVAALVVAAFRMPPADAAKRAGRPPTAAVVAAVSLIAFGIRPLLDSLSADHRAASGWIPTLAGLAVLIAFAAALARWSGCQGWDGMHVLAVATGALLATTLVAFTVDPLGDVSDPAKYSTNTVFLLLVIGLVALARRHQLAWSGRPSS